MIGMSGLNERVYRMRVTNNNSNKLMKIGLGAVDYHSGHNLKVLGDLFDTNEIFGYVTKWLC